MQVTACRAQGPTNLITPTLPGPDTERGLKNPITHNPFTKLPAPPLHQRFSESD